MRKSRRPRGYDKSALEGIDAARFRLVDELFGDQARAFASIVMLEAPLLGQIRDLAPGASWNHGGWPYPAKETKR